MTYFEDQSQDPSEPPKPDEQSDLLTAEGTYKDPIFQQQVHRLHQLTVWGRWLTVGLLWLILGPISAWSLRSDIALWLDYFTWTAVRYSLAYNHLAAICLALCIGSTVAVLFWQSRNILTGLPQREVNRLEKQVLQIRKQGRSHPLWKWVCKP
jgi:hypothetical protein